MTRKAGDEHARLLRKAQRGDAESFEALIAGSGHALRNHVTARIGPHLRGRVEIEDVLQEIYARALKSLATFQWRGQNAFLRWLKTIAEHVILKCVARQQREHLFYVSQDLPGAEPSPSTALRRGERFDRLQDALDSLSLEYREAVMLVRIEGLSMKEAARRMHRSPKAVQCIIARALKKLRDRLGDTESLHLPPRSLKRRDDAE